MPSRPTILSVSSASLISGIYAPDYYVRPFNIGIGVVLSASSTSTYGIEHTFDYTGSSAFISSNATWFPHTSITAMSCNRDGNYAFPVSAIRINATAISSGTITATFIQAG